MVESIISLSIPYRPYGIAFSSPMIDEERIAITSFEKSDSNIIQCFRLEDNQLVNGADQAIVFPQTRVMYSPTGQSVENLVTCGDCLRVFNVADGEIELAKEISVNDSADPVTCFDWSAAEERQIICGSTDATATAIDIPTGQTTAKLIAHDHPVHDICYFANASTFVTAGFDGSLRFFDLRDQMSSFIYFQTAMPLLRAAACPPNKIAVFAKGSFSATMVDVRRPCMPCGFGHQSGCQITGVAWSQRNAEALVTSDVNGLLSEFNFLTGEDLVLYEAGGPIESFALKNEKIAVCCNGKVDILQYV